MALRLRPAAYVRPAVAVSATSTITAERGKKAGSLSNIFTVVGKNGPEPEPYGPVRVKRTILGFEASSTTSKTGPAAAAGAKASVLAAAGSSGAPSSDHVNAVPEFLGQSTGFHKSKIKSGVLALGEVEGSDEVKYLHGQFGRGTFTFMGGHDPEDYQHMVGDPPTELSRYKHSPGYRLILNNVLFPAAEKKKQRT